MPRGGFGDGDLSWAGGNLKMERTRTIGPFAFWKGQEHDQRGDKQRQLMISRTRQCGMEEMRMAAADTGTTAKADGEARAGGGTEGLRRAREA